ncbi:MAG: capsule biosynthesis protein [Flavobacteriaceae bacterium]|nr:capsule biosynthesis protein [Flavobacteriaceae bacterium]
MKDHHNTYSSQSLIEEDEIDLIKLLKQIWLGKKIIINTVIIFSLLGLIIALSTPNSYTSSVTLVPQSSAKNNSAGSISSLAALAGVDLGSMNQSDELSPFVYPLIIKSIPFQLDLMNTPLNFAGIEKPISLYEYFTQIHKPSTFSIIKKYTIGLPGLLLNALKQKKNEAEDLNALNNKIYNLTEQEESVCNYIKENVSLELNSKEGYITLSSTFSQPLVAAEITERAILLLQDHITKIKISKAQDNLQFLKDRMEEKEVNFKKVQRELANFSDKNNNVTSLISSLKQQNLQSEYSLVFGVYSELAKQIEQAEIQVKKDTPILTILQPVQVPTERSAPKRSLILVICMFLGLVIGIGIVIIKSIFPNLKSQWESTQV